jgi:hypothetical protein
MLVSLPAIGLLVLMPRDVVQGIGRRERLIVGRRTKNREKGTGKLFSLNRALEPCLDRCCGYSTTAAGEVEILDTEDRVHRLRFPAA